MTNTPFGVGTVPPPQPPTVPGYSPRPPGPPDGGSRRRWPVLGAAAAVGAVIAAVSAAVITAQVRDTATEASAAPTPVTVTTAAPAPRSPVPLPTSQADRQTCQGGWIAAGNFIDSATEALAVLPKGVKIDDPAVRANPEWTAAVQRAGESYRQASDALKTQIAPGATPILAEAAATATKALRVLGDAISNSEAVNGNAGAIANEASEQMGVLCTRLAP